MSSFPQPAGSSSQTQDLASAPIADVAQSQQSSAPSTQPQQLRADASQAQNASSTGLSGATASDSAEGVARGGSKRSLTGRKRMGSTSSRRSQTAAAASAEKTERPASAGRASQATQPRAKKKSFLSFLNCCSAPDESNDIGMQDAPQAAKQSGKAQSTPSSQPTPPIVAQTSASPEQKLKSDEARLVDEKTAASSHADTPITQTANAPIGKLAEGELANDRPVTAGKDASTSGQETSIAENTSREQAPQQIQSQHLSPLATAAVGGVAAGAATGALAEAVMASNPNITVQTPTPVSPTSQASQASEQEQEQEQDQLISDRTPEQQARDTDIEMTDVGPSLPLTAEEANAIPHDESETARPQTSHVDLPPPPPLEERQAQMAPAVVLPPSGGTSRQPSPVNAQKWLLPAARPEHRGRKCLILDLDETLVHSSFKVRPVRLPFPASR